MQHAADSKHCRNCGHAYEYEAIYMGHMGRYRCPNCGRTRPEPQVAATSVALDGMRGSRVKLRTPQGDLELELKLPGLYNVYNAVAAAATALELGVPLATVGEALEGFGGRVRARGDDPGRRPPGVDPADQEPGRGERGAAHPDARGRAARPVDRAERRHRRRPRHLLDLGRRLRGAGRPRAARHVQRHARGGDGAAAEVRGHRGGDRGGPRPRATRSTAPWRTPPATTCTPSPPTRRCWSCATSWRSAASRSGGRSEPRAGGVRRLARRRERLLRRRPVPVAGARGVRARPDTGPRCRHRARRRRSRGARTRGGRARRGRRAAGRARADGRPGWPPSRRTLATSSSAAALRL